MTLSRFAGNPQTVSAAEQMLAAHRVPQTMIIEGPVGSGRKTLARLITAGLLCKSQNAPCGSCEICRLVQSGHPDVAVVTPLKDKAAISVDQVREVRASASVKPNQGSHKVYIFDGAMNDAAQNALLKLLEEPPAFDVFMLICPHRSSFISTVVSRAVVLTLSGVTYEQALPVLPLLGLPAGEDTRAKLEAAHGVLGELLQKDDPYAKARTAALSAAQALASGSRSEFIKATALLKGERTQLPAFYDELYRILFAALTATVSGTAAEPALTISRRLPRAKILAMTEILAEDRKILPLNPNVGLLLTALCARLNEEP